MLEKERLYTHTHVATVFINLALSTSVMLPSFRFASVAFPNLDGTTNPIGSSFGLPPAEIGLENSLVFAIGVLS